MTPKLLEHLEYFFTGAAGLGIVAHAVNTFPIPKNPYGQWLLGVIQFAVGQRQLAKTTFNKENNNNA